MTDRASLFHGIAVLIDDEIGQRDASITKIQDSIIEAGCHVVPLNSIPTERSIENLREVAFVVLDWNFKSPALTEAGSEGIVMPSLLKQEHDDNVLRFLKQIKESRFAPVFVFTNEHVADVLEVLRENDLYQESDPSHILVKSKAEVVEQGVFSVLEEWLETAPSVYVLKSWERQYEKAKNELFLDFYTKSTVWPLILWQTFKTDGVPPATLLGEIIGGNLTSRMTPLNCDLEPFMELLSGMEKEEHKAAIKGVLEGERFLRNDRLDKNSIEPGDIFQLPDGGGFRINIRPVCDTVARAGSMDNVELYVLKGAKIEETELAKLYEKDFGLIRENDNKAVVYPVLDGCAISFRLSEIQIKKWSALKNHRVGWLLPPFLTRLQQRYAAYLQRPGLTRLPDGLFAPNDIVAIESDLGRGI